MARRRPAVHRDLEVKNSQYATSDADFEMPVPIDAAC